MRPRPTLRDPSELGKAYDHRIVKRLLPYIETHMRKVVMALVLTIVANSAIVAGPYVISTAIDSGIIAGNVRVLDLAVIVFIGLNMISLGTSYAQTYLMYFVAQQVVCKLRQDLFGHLQTLPFSFFDRVGIGKVMSRVQNDVNVLSELLSFAIVGVVSDVLSLAGIMIVLLYMNAQLALVTFCVVPLLLAIIFVWRRRARLAYRATRESIANVNGMLQEAVTGMRVIQSTGREKRSFCEFEKVNRNNRSVGLRAVALASILPPGVDMVAAIATGLVIWFGGSLVLGVQLTPGELVAFLLYIGRFFGPIRDLSQRYDTFQSAMAAGERMFDLLDTQSDVADKPGALELRGVRGGIRFEAVTFGYDHNPVIKRLDLDITPGEVLAIVGETGAGKTSLVNLVGRFYDVWSGSVSIDGRDVRDVTLRSLRQQLGMVIQEPFLFSDSIMENIRFGRAAATDEEVIAAAKSVSADEFIQRLPNGYQTMVQERGIRLSTGQRQLIALARAVLTDPRILILDEATASIDQETECLIQKALNTLLRGRTALIIAHRLSTARQADRIIVIHDGEIVEEGTHDDLVALDGRYAKLWRLQFEPIESRS